MQTHLQVTITGAAEDTSGDIDIRCNLVDQDSDNRKRCPNGQSALIDEIRSRAGFSVVDRSDDDNDDVFTMPVFTQNRSGWNSSLSMSHGSLSEPETVTRNQTTKVQLSLGDFSSSGDKANPYKVDLASKILTGADLEVDFILSAKSPGRLFDSVGTVVYTSGTPLIISGDNLLTRLPVVGNISVSYTVSGQLQTASIHPRDDVAAGNYDVSLWIASTCGQVSNFEIEVPECYQQAWWGKNGYPGEEAGDVEITEPPNYADQLDIDNNWLTCGRHKAADQQTAERYKDAPGTGEVYYPGIKESELAGDECKSEEWG